MNNFDINFPKFSCHCNGGRSVAILTDAAEFVIYINPPVDLFSVLYLILFDMCSAVVRLLRADFAKP